MTQRIFPDFMLDIETTGTDPYRTAILQIGLVPFNIDNGDVDETGLFRRSLVMPATRLWDEGTREWWGKRPALLADIRSRAEPVKPVLEALQQHVIARTIHTNGKVRVWAKPTTFDVAFIESYFKDFEVGTPFDFRQVVDMRSYMGAKMGFDAIRDFEQSIDFVGDAHDALMDALHQTKVVLRAAGFGVAPPAQAAA